MHFCDSNRLSEFTGYDLSAMCYTGPVLPDNKDVKTQKHF